MFIKDPSRFKIRNVRSKDCVQLYQLVKQCYLEIVENQSKCFNHRKSHSIKDQTLYPKCLNRDSGDENDLNNNNVYKEDMNTNNSTLLESFEEFVRCLGFGKRTEQDKVLDCLLIEDLNENRIIAFVTFSYGYFSYAGKEIHMNHFYVRTEYRHNGFGKFLMRNLLMIAAEAKLYKIKYDVPRTCEDFCEFMKKLGAKDFTEDTNYILFKMDLKTIENRLKTLR